MNSASCSTVGFRKTGAVSRMKSFQNWPGSSSTSGVGPSRMPRLQQIDVSLEEAAYDLGASRFRAFRSVTFPLLLPAVVSAYLIAFTTSFDEYAVASFVVGTQQTFPIYLYSALRFPNNLPQVIAVAVVVISVSLLVVVGAEIGRRVAERRLGAVEL